MKAFSLVLVVVIAVLSGYYLTTYPENAYPYFSSYNSYLGYIQSSMLQNSISLKDTQATVELIKWLDVNFDNASVFIVHEAFYNWAIVYFSHKSSLISILETDVSQPSRQTTLQSIVSASSNAVEKGYKAYTIWWKNGKGWYSITELPSDFIEVKASGDMALYLYTE